MSNFVETFLERIQELLDRDGLTYQQAAEESKIARKTIYGWLKYNIPPKTESLIKLARFFQCPIDFLIGETEETKIKFSDNPVSFSDRLKALIKEKKITAYRACMQLHIKTDIMSVWSNKGSLPSYTHLTSLIDYFGCSADYLLGLTDKR